MAPAGFRVAAHSEVLGGAAMVGRVVLYLWQAEGCQWIHGTVAHRSRASGFSHVVRYGCYGLTQHLQIRSFRYLQNCAIYDFIGLIYQYIQYVQYTQCVQYLVQILYTKLTTLFAHKFCTSVWYISFAQLFAQSFCTFICTYFSSK